MKSKILYFIIGCVFSFSLTISAQYMFHAREIEFESNDTNWKVNNVNEAINDINESIITKKSLIAQAVSSKGIQTPDNTSFDNIINNILALDTNKTIKYEVLGSGKLDNNKIFSISAICPKNTKYVIGIEASGSVGSAYNVNVKNQTKNKLGSSIFCSESKASSGVYIDLCVSIVEASEGDNVYLGYTGGAPVGYNYTLIALKDH